MKIIKFTVVLILLHGLLFFAQASSSPKTVKDVHIGGLLQLWGKQTISNPANGTFLMRRMELKVSGKILNENIEFVAMIDPVSKSVLVDDAGNKNQIINITQDLFFVFSLSDYAKLKVGQFLYPLTREGLASTEFLRFTERSLVGSIVGDKRDIGLEVSGSLKFVQYSVAILNGSGPNALDNNKHKDVAARVVFKPVNGLEIGGSTYLGTASVQGTNEKRRRYAAEFAFSSDRWGILCEYASVTDGSLKAQGYYGAFYYEIFPELEASLRYQNWDPNTNSSSDMLSIFSFGTGYYLFNRHLKFLLDYNLSSPEKSKSSSEIVTGVQIFF